MVRKAKAIVLFGSIVAGILGMFHTSLASVSNQPFMIATYSHFLNADDLRISDVDTSVVIQNSFLMANAVPIDSLNITKSPRIGIAREMYVDTTGYNSEVAQTDDTPFITANGMHVYDGLIAANFLKFGTKVVFPDHFGDKVFTVNDRMNRRYTERVDIWFPERQQAIQWGVRKVRIQILEG